MQKDLISKKCFPVFFICLFLVFISLCFVVDGIGNGGDSILHYLIAKYAPQHPNLFFFHWGKPVFTFLATSFSQFGFTGIKIFNTLCTFIAIYFSYQLANFFQIKNAGLILFLVLLWPLTIAVNFTGLTEPLFACLLVYSVYLIAKEKHVQGAICLSFLPFVRSEGLIILLVIGLYFILHRKYFSIALLSIGHLVLSIAGYWVYHDITWVFSKIPYAYLNPIYGKGTWDHFFIQLNFMIGPIQYVLFGIAVLISILKIKNTSFKNILSDPKFFLIYVLFGAFFTAHTLFWGLGIFGSMGLTRVFYGIMPILAIVILEGFNQIQNWTLVYAKKYNTHILSIILILVFIFPFLNNPASYSLKKDLYLSNEEHLLQDSVSLYLKNSPNQKLLVASNYSLPYFLNIDPFDSSVYQSGRMLNKLVANKKEFVYVWDNWFSDVEDQLYIEKFVPDSGFELLRTFESRENNKTHVFKIFNHPIK
jgi:hypothetical protein